MAPTATPRPPAAVYPDPEIDTYELPGVAPVGMDCPRDAPIKANISTRGDWIFHVPGDQYYGRTRPETCFATAAEARAAGFRPPAAR